MEIVETSTFFLQENCPIPTQNEPFFDLDTDSESRDAAFGNGSGDLKRSKTKKLETLLFSFCGCLPPEGD